MPLPGSLLCLDESGLVAVPDANNGAAPMKNVIVIAIAKITDLPALIVIPPPKRFYKFLGTFINYCTRIRNHNPLRGMKPSGPWP